MHFHLSCIAAAVSIGRRIDDHEIGYGFTQYQAHWTEQTEAAVRQLEEVLNSAGFSLLLPVAEIMSKGQAMSELRDNRLSTAALEQKSLARNAELTSDLLNAELRRWRSCA